MHLDFGNIRIYLAFFGDTSKFCPLSLEVTANLAGFQLKHFSILILHLASQILRMASWMVHRSKSKQTRVSKAA